MFFTNLFQNLIWAHLLMSVRCFFLIVLSKILSSFPCQNRWYKPSYSFLSAMSLPRTSKDLNFLSLLPPCITPKSWKEHKFLSYSNIMLLSEFCSTRIPPKKFLTRKSSQKISLKKILIPYFAFLVAEKPFGLVSSKDQVLHWIGWSR